MAHVICVNGDCPEYRIVKDAYDHPADDIVCGACGDPVEETPEDHGLEPGEILPDPGGD